MTKPSWGIWLGVAVVAVAAAVTLIGMHRTEPRPASPSTARPPAQSPPDTRLAVFGDQRQGDIVLDKLSQRLQGLVHRIVRGIDNLENETEDPEQLDAIFTIDHLATQLRRQGENVAVLAGGALQRRPNTPVELNAVLRAATAEIGHFGRVDIIEAGDLQIHGRAVAEVIHLLAELLENATQFTNPDAPKVVLRTWEVQAGLFIQVQDRGVGMPREHREHINSQFTAQASLDVRELLTDGRIGLGVVKKLAQRYGIRVRLDDNVYGGVDATVVLPEDLLVRPAAAQPHLPSRQETTAGETRRADLVGTGSSHAASPGPYQPGGDPPPARAGGTPEALPMRDPGTSFPVTPTVHSGPSTGVQPPPLPQRSASATHLPPELYDAPSQPTVVPGHNTTAAEAARQGFALGEAAAATPRATDPTSSQGDSPWSTT